jgi:hypothetical protein
MKTGQDKLKNRKCNLHRIPCRRSASRCFRTGIEAAVRIERALI